MADIPEEDLAETRAALAPTLEATAAILPWVSKPRQLRFDAKLNERWIAAGKRLAEAWQDRHGKGIEEIRSAIFNLYAIAIESADSNCLRLGEALASAADSLEIASPSLRLVAAITGAVECLSEPDGLEHEAFADRALHFSTRLESTLSAPDNAERSAVLDRLFVGEADEQIEFMRDALAALPPDAYALTTEAMKLAQQAEQLELWGIMHLARQLTEYIGRNAAELDTTERREEIEAQISTLSAAISAVVA
jgi:hypothetical protein